MGARDSRGTLRRTAVPGVVAQRLGRALVRCEILLWSVRPVLAACYGRQSADGEGWSTLDGYAVGIDRRGSMDRD